MKKVILHIGAEKTGTTSIQAFLKMNQNVLEKQGFFIPDFLSDHGNHRIMATMAFNLDRIDDFVRSQGLLDERERESTYKLWQERFHHVCGNDNHDVWIISSEHMQSRLTSHQEIERIRNIIQRHFDDVSVLLYIRDPIDAAISLWSTLVKGGHDIVKLPKPDDWHIRNNCHYKSIITRWEEVFTGKISVRIFDNNFFTNGDLISDFSNFCKIAQDDGFILPKRQNESLSYAAVVVLSTINSRLKEIGKPRIDDNNKISDLIRKRFSGFATFSPTSSDIEEYQAYYNESNEWVRSNYFNQMNTIFESRIPILPCNPISELDFHEVSKSLCDVIADLW